MGLILSGSKDRQCSRAERARQEREHDDTDVGDYRVQWPVDPPDSCFEDPSLFSESQCDASAHQAGESRSQETLQAAPREASRHRTLEDLRVSAEMARILPLLSAGVCKILPVRDN